MKLINYSVLDAISFGNVLIFKNVYILRHLKLEIMSAILASNGRERETSISAAKGFTNIKIIYFVF